jgi:spermidine synthase
MDHFDVRRAEAIEAQTRYWNRGVHRASFELPNFVRQAIRGEDPFAG